MGNSQYIYTFVIFAILWSIQFDITDRKDFRHPWPFSWCFTCGMPVDSKVKMVRDWVTEPRGEGSRFIRETARST